MLLREGPAQKAFCGMSPNLASRGRGGRGERCRKPVQAFKPWTSYPQLHTTEKTKSLFFQKSPAGGFFFWTYCIFSANFWWIFSGFRTKFQKIVTCVAFSIKFAKTNQKFAENSEFCENYSLFFKIIHFTPYRKVQELDHGLRHLDQCVILSGTYGVGGVAGRYQLRGGRYQAKKHIFSAWFSVFFQ